MNVYSSNPESCYKEKKEVNKINYIYLSTKAHHDVVKGWENTGLTTSLRP